MKVELSTYSIKSRGNRLLKDPLELRLRNVQGCFQFLKSRSCLESEKGKLLFQLSERAVEATKVKRESYRVADMVKKRLFSALMLIERESDLHVLNSREFLNEGEDSKVLKGFKENEIWKTLPWVGRGERFIHFKESLLEGALLVLDLDHRVAALFKLLRQVQSCFFSTLSKEELIKLQPPSCFDRFSWEQIKEEALSKEVD